MNQLSRRKLLASAPFLGASALLASASEPSATPPANPPLKVIVTGGHPGDPEYGCGGTISRLAASEHNVALLYLNRGEGVPASAESARIRTAEAEEACKILKARPLFAGQTDGQAIVDPAHYERFRNILEAERPHIVLTHWPIDNHADHRAISMLVYDAWLRMKKSFALYYYEVSNGEDTLQFAPNHYVNITAAEPVKRLACHAHASQAPEKFYKLQETVTRFRGIEGGFTQAEAFIRHLQSPPYFLPGA